MRSSSSPQFFLALTAGVLVCAAAGIWSVKQRPGQSGPALYHMAPQELQATALLQRSYRADNQLSYAALSKTIALVGNEKVESRAHIVRAPHHLSVQWLSGPGKGQCNGYSQQWFWHRSEQGILTPYATVALDADRMAARRFALLLQNYRVTLGDVTQIGGRRAQTLELRPLHLAPGASGPARRLFIDQETGLTIGVESFNWQLKPTLKSALSEVELHSKFTPVTFESPDTLRAASRKQSCQGEEMALDYEGTARKTGIAPPRAATLPPGFTLEGYGIHNCRTTGTLQVSAFSRYSDGLNTLTIFAFKPVSISIKKTMRGSCDFGAGTMTSREDGAGRLVAVSDLPLPVLNTVLNSAHFESVQR